MYEINAQLKPATIITNTEELKENLAEKMKEYETAVFTEETKGIAKAELASLRKLRADVETRRKEIKNQIMEPYFSLEKEVKELVAIIDKPINLINAQLDEIEAERIRKKREEVCALYDEVIGEASEYLPYDRIFDKKWVNAGTSMKKIREAMEGMVVKASQELSILQNSPSDVKDEALQIYKKDGDLAAALTHINTYECNKAKALENEERRRREEESKRREEEIERARAMERAHIKELEKARAEKVASEEPCGFDVPEIDDSALPFTQPTTITAFYRVVATPEELEQVEMAFNSIGIYFERKDG